jgi:hypothetical protein
VDAEAILQLVGAAMALEAFRWCTSVTKLTEAIRQSPPARGLVVGSLASQEDVTIGKLLTMSNELGVLGRAICGTVVAAVGDLWDH